jgi:hypothetical protein
MDTQLRMKHVIVSLKCSRLSSFECFLIARWCNSADLCVGYSYWVSSGLADAAGRTSQGGT